jgi:cytochrome c553
MNKWIYAAALVLVPAFAVAADSPPDWAYLPPTPGFKPPPDSGQPTHRPGSTKAYTQEQVDDIFNPPDWYPDEHPPMPQLVAHGKPPVVHGCAQCHLTTGRGHPESANIAALPAGYIEEQIAQFRSGQRTSAIKARSIMDTFGKALTDDDVKEAAQYFASIKPARWTEVVETDTVPKTFIGEGAMRFVSPGGAKEPLGRRIITVPSDEAGAKARDPHSPFIAYVPKGSIEAGQKLAMTGGDGKTFQCSICHGSDYHGEGNVPGLAGRGALYIFRQLYDIQHGTRKGPAVALMEPVVKNLSQDDMIDLAAFMSSRTP